MYLCPKESKSAHKVEFVYGTRFVYLEWVIIRITNLVHLHLTYYAVFILLLLLMLLQGTTVGV